MRLLVLLAVLSGCASPCPPLPGNKIIMGMGEPISDEELAKLDLPKPEQKNICR